MPKRALVERRPWLLASLAAAIAYYVLKDGAFPGTYLYLLEAGAMLLLAIYALLRHSGGESRMLAGVMALAGIGVVAVELDPWWGATALMVGSGLAIGLFLSHRRESLSSSQRITAVALMFLTPAIIWMLTADRSIAMIGLFFGIVLGGMAGAAWVSAFPRYRVGMGAVFYVISSILSVAGAGALVDSDIPGLIAWPLFYLGHFLMCIGVIQTLRGDHRS